MRKIAVFIVLILAVSGTAFTDEAENNNPNKNDNSFTMTSMLIKDGLNKNFFQIQQASLNLTDTQKFMLYNTYESKIGLPLALNLLVGFGLGSGIQGDIAGTLVGSLGDLTGVIMVLVGVLMITDYETDWNTYTITYPNFDKGMNLLTASYIVLGLSRVAQIIFPITFAPRYNRKLQEALNYGNITFNFTPSLDFDGNAKVAAAVSMKF